jgi:hypothetical protein
MGQFAQRSAPSIAFAQKARRARTRRRRIVTDTPNIIHYLQFANDVVSGVHGKDYAREHPALVGAIVQAVAIERGAAAIAHAVDEHRLAMVEVANIANGIASNRNF